MKLSEFIEALTDKLDELGDVEVVLTPSLETFPLGEPPPEISVLYDFHGEPVLIQLTPAVR